MKSAEDEMHIVEKYRELGSYRAAGDACGVDHKTVKAVVDRVARGDVGAPRKPVAREHNYDAVADVVRRRVEQTRGRISAKRLLPAARVEGYDGSDRNFRHLGRSSALSSSRIPDRPPHYAHRDSSVPTLTLEHLAAPTDHAPKTRS